jgi:hypothetical protein
MSVGAKRLRIDGQTFSDVVEEAGGGLELIPNPTIADEGKHVKLAADGTLETSAIVEDASSVDFTGKEIKNFPQLFSGGPMTLACGGGGDLSLVSGTFGGDLKLSAPGGLIQVLTNTNMNGYSLSNIQNIDAGTGTLSITGTGFPRVAIGGGLDLQNTGFIYRCLSLYGENGLVLGTDNLGTVIQSGPFGSRQDEMTILPGIVTFGTPTTNVPTVILNGGNIQNADSIEATTLRCLEIKRNGPAGDIIVDSDLDLNQKVIKNASEVQSNNTVRCASLQTLEMKRDPALGAGDLLVNSDLNLNQSDIKDAGDVQSTSLQINSKVIYVPDGQMPASYASNTTYVLLGSRTVSSTINLNGLDNVCFKGMSRDNSIITYNQPSGELFLTVDCNLSFFDLTLRTLNTGTRVLTATNLAKDKTLGITNCLIKDSFDFATITGYELVDISNTLFLHLRGPNGFGPVSQSCLQFTDPSKVNVSSCEFVKFYELGGTTTTNLFDGPMLDFQGTSGGAVNINNCILHPRGNQDAIRVASGFAFLEFCVIGNTFINMGLTTGSLLQTNSNIVWNNNAIVEGNSLLPNLKAKLGMQYYSAVPATTTLTAVDTPIRMEFQSGVIADIGSFGVRVDTTVAIGTNVGRITYLRKRPVNFQITGTFEVLLTSGSPNSQNIGVTLSKNGVSLYSSGVVSFQTLETVGTNPKQFSFSVIGEAVQSDYFEFELVSNNLSGVSDLQVRSFLVSGIEI